MSAPGGGSSRGVRRDGTVGRALGRLLLVGAVLLVALAERESERDASRLPRTAAAAAAPATGPSAAGRRFLQQSPADVDADVDPDAGVQAPAAAEADASLGNQSLGHWGGAVQTWAELGVNTTRCSNHFEGPVCRRLRLERGCDALVSPDFAPGMRVSTICEAECSVCVCQDSYNEMVQHHETLNAPHTAEHVSPCTELLSLGNYSCGEHFCPDCDFRGLCDATCGLCEYDSNDAGDCENAYDALNLAGPYGCSSLMQNHGLTCVADFCPSCGHRGFCSHMCGFCEADPTWPQLPDGLQAQPPGQAPLPAQPPNGTQTFYWCLMFGAGSEAGTADRNTSALLCHSPVVWIASLLLFGCVFCSCAGFCCGYKTGPILAKRKFDKKIRMSGGEVEMADVRTFPIPITPAPRWLLHAQMSRWLSGD